MSTAIKACKNLFNNEDIRAVRSPFRIAPLGAHLDHQGGCVTGMALDASIDLVHSPNVEGIVNVHSLDFEGEEKFHIDEELEFVPGFWGNYLRGAVISLQEDFKLTKGINGLLNGNS